MNDTIMKSLEQISAATLVLYITGFIGIMVAFSGVVIKLYKLIEKYRRFRNDADCKDKMIAKHNDDITELKENHKTLSNSVCVIDEKVSDITEMLRAMQKKSDETEMAKANGKLLEMYRYYTSPDRNGEWTNIESESFWMQFNDYERRGGNGFIHKNVEPAMRKLKVVDVI